MKILLKDNIKYIIVHCSDTEKNLTAIDIHNMHLGFGWDGIGYHKVIKNDGEIENGRPEYWVGAHVKGLNDCSLGICLIGKNSFSELQMQSLKIQLFKWKKKYPNAKVVGHRDSTNTSKTADNDTTFNRIARRFL